MNQKNVEDYLKQGIYGVRLPKEEERARFLGTLRERVVIALTKGEVMSNSGIHALEQAMKHHPETKLILNGNIAMRFLKEEKRISDKHRIPFTAISNDHYETDIGAVLTYDYAIHKESIFITELKKDNKTSQTKQHESNHFWNKLTKFFS